MCIATNKTPPTLIYFSGFSVKMQQCIDEIKKFIVCINDVEFVDRDRPSTEFSIRNGKLLVA